MYVLLITFLFVVYLMLLQDLINVSSDPTYHKGSHAPSVPVRGGRTLVPSDPACCERVIFYFVSFFVFAYISLWVLGIITRSMFGQKVLRGQLVVIGN